MSRPSQKRHVVTWTEIAAQDLDRLAAYLAVEAPLRGEQLLDRIIARADSLETFPERGRTPPELRSIGDQSWREIVEAPWRVVYRITEKAIEIHAVLDGRRHLEDLLMERLLDS